MKPGSNSRTRLLKTLQMTSKVWSIFLCPIHFLIKRIAGASPTKLLFSKNEAQLRDRVSVEFGETNALQKNEELLMENRPSAQKAKSPKIRYIATNSELTSLSAHGSFLR